jgi:hypothetical protein
LKKHNYINAICFGWEIYKVFDMYNHFKKFNSLTDARKYAKQYTNAHVIRLYFNEHGQLSDYREF